MDELYKAVAWVGVIGILGMIAIVIAEERNRSKKDCSPSNLQNSVDRSCEND